MHEIGIAESIVQIAEANARGHHAQAVRVIGLRLGTFTTIVPEALQFAFEVCRQGTLSENARLVIESVPMVTHCVVCAMSTQPVKGVCLICERCGFPLEILAGEELQIDYIEVDSEQEESSWNENRNESQSRPMC